MDKKILEELKSKLEEKKKQLEKELSSFAEKVEGDWKAKYEDIGDEWDDNAHEVAEYATNVPLEETLEERLKEIEKALKRIEDGSYGICEVGGEEIPLERLRAKPETTTCLKHSK